MPTLRNEKITYFRWLFCVGIWVILCPFSTYGQGLITPTVADTMPPQYFELLEKGGESLPITVSLRQYCPKPADQGLLNTCVAFACSHAALTITKQVQSPKKNVKDNPYSAKYLYKNIDMRKGVEFDTVLNFMKINGVCRVDNFQNSTDERKWTAEAEQNKIDWESLFSIRQKKLDYEKVRNTFKKVIMDGFPIILGVNIISKDFQKLRQMKWEPPVKIKDTLKHAMVIVGYDDNTKTFDLMNSRGSGWGSGGFIQLSYADFERVFESAYILGKRKYSSRGDGTTDSLSLAIDSTRTALIGTFQLKYVENTPDSRQFRAQSLQFSENPNESIYETKERFAVNSQFKLHVEDIPNDKKLYIFSLDAVGRVTLHWQPDTSLEQEKQWIITDSVLVIPASDSMAIGVKYKGKDQMILLISDSIITNFEQKLDAFRAKKGTAQARLEAAFGDALVPVITVDYRKSDDTTMSVKSRVWRPENQKIVPIILDIRMAD